MGSVRQKKSISGLQLLTTDQAFGITAGITCGAGVPGAHDILPYLLEHLEGRLDFENRFTLL